MGKFDVDFSATCDRYGTNPTVEVVITGHMDPDDIYALYLKAGGKDYKDEAEEALDKITDLERKIDELEAEAPE